MNFTPLHNKVLIQQAEADTLSSGGIHLPGVGEKANKGTVVAVGLGNLNDAGVRVPLDVACGDTVFFGKYNATNEIEVEGNKYLIMSENALLGVITED